MTLLVGSQLRLPYNVYEYYIMSHDIPNYFIVMNRLIFVRDSPRIAFWTPMSSITIDIFALFLKSFALEKLLYVQNKYHVKT